MDEQKPRYANIKIRKTSAYPTYEIVVDGQDMSQRILVEGFDVDFERARVTMVVEADVLELDLPDVVVNALRHGDTATVESTEAPA